MLNKIKLLLSTYFKYAKHSKKSVHRKFSELKQRQSSRLVAMETVYHGKPLHFIKTNRRFHAYYFSESRIIIYLKCNK